MTWIRGLIDDSRGPVQELWDSLRSQAGLVALLTVIILVTRHEVQTSKPLRDWMIEQWPVFTSREIRLRVTGVVFWGLVPMALVVLVHRKNLLRDFGLQLPKARWFAFALVYLAIVHPINWLYASDPELLGRVPFYEPAREGGSVFWAYQLLIVFYMFGWEFFLRGYILLGLRERIGILAVFVQLIPFVMLHYSYPTVELYFSIIDGVFLGTLVYACRSIWPAVLIHVLQNLLWEVEVVYWFNA